MCLSVWGSRPHPIRWPRCRRKEAGLEEVRCHLHDFMQHLDLVFYGNLDYEEYLEKLETFVYAVHIVILEFELSYDIENSDGFETVRDFGLRPIRRRFVKGVVRMTGFDKGVRGRGQLSDRNYVG